MTFTAVIAIPPQAGEAISHLEDHFVMLVMTFTAVIAIPPQAGEAICYLGDHFAMLVMTMINEISM